MPEPGDSIQTAHDLLRDERLADAEDILVRILRFHPRHPEANTLMAMALLRQGQKDRAVYFAERAAAGEPDSPLVRNTLGVALTARGGDMDLDRAILQYREAMRLMPEWAPPLINLGSTLELAGRLGEAADAMEIVLRAMPNDLVTLRNYVMLLLRAGRTDLARPVYTKALKLYPDDRQLWESYTWFHNYAHETTPRESFEAHLRLAQHIEGPAGSDLLPAPAIRDPNPERPLRIGILSPDLRRHSVANFLEPLLECHDHERYPMTCYHFSPFVDDVTDRLRAMSDGFHQMETLSTHDVAKRIRDGNTDILVDLAGHTRGSAVEALALRPAPIQVTYLGYPNTTGMRSVDWRIIDSITDPPGADAVATERLWRLDPCFVCYRPIPEAPDIGPPPSAAAGYVTFCMFNATTKATPFMVGLWCRILREVPGSRMLVKAVWEDQNDKSWIAKMFLSQFENNGIDPSRIERAPYMASRRDYQELYNRADVVLDPFPFNGTTTSCEALWMGLPIVTMKGDRHIARVGASLMTAIGLDDLVAATPDDYVRIAAAIARDPARRASLRKELRDRMTASPLRDEKGFARRFQDALREMWRQRCAAARFA